MYERELKDGLMENGPFKIFNYYSEKDDNVPEYIVCDYTSALRILARHMTSGEPDTNPYYTAPWNLKTNEALRNVIHPTVGFELEDMGLQGTDILSWDYRSDERCTDGYETTVDYHYDEYCFLDELEDERNEKGPGEPDLSEGA